MSADAHRGVTGAVVAGGANERFGGEPKGLRRVGGIRIIDRVASAIRAVTPEIVLVTNAPDADQWLAGVPVHRDLRSERGSLVGIHTAIASIPADGIALVVAWDMPFVSAGLLSLLTRRVREGASAAIPESPAGPEPFCAAYTPACLVDIERAIARGDFRMSSIVDRAAQCFARRRRRRAELRRPGAPLLQREHARGSRDSGADGGEHMTRRRGRDRLANARRNAVLFTPPPRSSRLTSTPARLRAVAVLLSASLACRPSTAVSPASISFGRDPGLRRYDRLARRRAGVLERALGNPHRRPGARRHAVFAQRRQAVHAGVEHEDSHERDGAAQLGPDYRYRTTFRRARHGHRRHARPATSSSSAAAIRRSATTCCTTR